MSEIVPPASEAQRMFDAIFQAAVETTAPGAAADDWPAGYGGDRE